METIYNSAGEPHGVAGPIWLDPSLSINPRVDGSGNALGGYLLSAVSSSFYVQDADTPATLAGTLVFPGSTVNVASGIATVSHPYLPLAGGTLTGPLDLGGYNLTNAPNLAYKGVNNYFTTAQYVQYGTASAVGFGVALAGDANLSLSISVAGVVSFGPGGASALDTTLSRNANGLTLNRAFDATSFYLNGSLAINPSGVLQASLSVPASIVTGTLGPTHGGTGLATVASGALLYASGVDTWAARSIGSTNQVLKVSGALPTWGSVAFSEVTGNLAYSQLPTGSGSWDAGSGNTTTITRALTVSGILTASAGILPGAASSPGQGGINLDTTEGLRIRGKTGSSTDLSLDAPGGTQVAYIPTGTTNFTVAGILSAGSGISPTGGSLVAGRISKTAANGLTLGAIAGSTYDASLYAVDGTSALWANPTGTKHLNLAVASGALVGIGTGGYASGITLNVTGDIHSTTYSRAASGFRLTANDNYILPGGSSDRSALKSNSSTGVLLRFQTSDDVARGFIGYTGSNFGLFASDATDGVTVLTDRVKIQKTPYERFSSADYLIAKVVVVTSAPTDSTPGPDGTLFVQVA